jgi:hypothetical protein
VTWWQVAILLESLAIAAMSLIWLSLVLRDKWPWQR